METNASTKIKSPGGKPSIIDCDIHATIPLDGIKPYLPRIYREQVETWGRRLPGQNQMYLNGGTNGSM
ncbi:MAG: amidohydrolase, partial [Paenibacillus sp.]|nr:amidohydrolase [Paenibacillus sp.]